MEGTLLTVEETVELAPASTPAPRRRAAARGQPRSLLPSEGDAPAEAVDSGNYAGSLACSRKTRHRFRQRRAVAIGEPEAVVSDRLPAPDVPIYRRPRGAGCAA